jgi:cobalt-zinc-cadmium efflux system outer membrane protein
MKALRAFARIFAPSFRLICVLAVGVGIVAGQTETAPGGAPQQSATTMRPPSGSPVTLEELIREVEPRNPDVAAAQQGYQASTHVAGQVSAFPDTQVMVQHFGVGSPRPFAGYSNSDFAYIGLGASQEIPYPGKRGLRAQVASQEAEAKRFQVDSARRGVVDQLKAAYFHLAYLQETLGILERNDEALRDVQKITESRYSVGQGNQQEVLKAQLQHTKILQAITMHHREVGQMQAQLKQLLNRAQDSPDIQTLPLALRPIPYTASQLMDLAKQQNPDIQAQQQMVKQSDSQVELSRKEFRPDFNVQYMWQHTNGDTRDYYMATFGINLPNRGRRKAELAQAEANREQAKRMLEAEQQRRLAEVQDQFVVAQTSAEQLKIYKEGLIPQSESTFRSAQAAYQSGKQDFETMLNSFLDVLSMQIEYQRELADHETALARLEALTGVDVR